MEEAVSARTSRFAGNAGRAVTRARRSAPSRLIGRGVLIRDGRNVGRKQPGPAKYGAPVAPARPDLFSLHPEPRPKHARSVAQAGPMGYARREESYTRDGAHVTPAQARRIFKKFWRAGKKGEQQ
jgi:hypothetical protein